MRSVMMIILGVLTVSTTVIHASGKSGPMWAAPSAMAVKRVSDVPGERHQPDSLSNLDCTELTYRLVGDRDMRTGCFTPTAFGMLDSDNDTVIFNGTDEGLPLSSDSPGQVLVPWPKALNLITLDAADTGGSYIGMYKDPLAALEDRRDWAGRLIGKRLVEPPHISLRDRAGRLLVVNPQTMAFSDGGSWLVMETLNGYFVRVNLASLEQLAFAPAFGAQGSPALLQSQVAISDDGRYVAIGNETAGSLKIYDLDGCGGNPCPAHEYRPFVSQRISGLRKIRHLRFVNDGLLSFEATTDGGQDGIYELAPSASITSLIDYLGLGDSYTSGEGAFDYLAGTDTADNTCHLSVNSYPLLLSRDLFSAGGGHSVACSGAVIDDVGSTSGSYRGQVAGGRGLDELRRARSAALDPIMAGFSPGYVAQHRFVAQYQPRVVTVSIGGNDIGFGDILERCVVPHLSRHLSDETCYNTYESRQELVNLVDRTAPRWTALYRQLRAESPGSTLYAIGYPSIASDTGKCPLNVNLGKSELEFAEELIHYLDGAIRQAAGSAGVSYVDISQALDGHRLCEAGGAGVAVNGLTAGNDFGPFGTGLLGRESYHPNALGHQLIEQAILRQTSNLSAAEQSTAKPDGGNLLDAPKTGRRINTLVPDNITKRSARAGQSISIRIDGARDGLRPNSTYTVRLDSPDGPTLVNATSGADGSISEPVVVPADTVPDVHTVDLVGPGQDDSQLDVTQPIYVYVPGDSQNPDGGAPADAISAEGTTPGATPGVMERMAIAGGQVLGVDSEHRPEPVSLSANQPSKQPQPAPRQGGGTAGKVAVLVVCGVLAAPVYRWRRIIKSCWDYFGQLCNN